MNPVQSGQLHIYTFERPGPAENLVEVINTFIGSPVLDHSRTPFCPDCCVEVYSDCIIQLSVSDSRL